MHSVHLADLAAVLSQQGPAILYRREIIPAEAVSRYWTSSRTRFELWHRALARYQRAETAGNWIEMRQWWRDHTGVLEEIFVSELLTRVVAALAAGLDHERGEDELSPITHAIYLSHLETSNRVQRMMLFGRGGSVQTAVRLNRLRKGVQRWTDALLGQLWSSVPEEICYAIDPNRARSCASDARGEIGSETQETANWLLAAAMHDTLSRRCHSTASLPQANRSVGDSVMLMMRPELFDSVGTLKSMWLHRIQYDCERTSMVLNDMFRPQAVRIDAEEVKPKPHHTFDRW